MLDDIKLSLRINNSAFNNEINDLIESAKLDLGITGVNTNKTVGEGEEETIDPLIKRAITIYVKANFGWDNPDAERLQQSYVMLKQHLSLSGDYNVVE